MVDGCRDVKEVEAVLPSPRVKILPFWLKKEIFCMYILEESSDIQDGALRWCQGIQVGLATSTKNLGIFRNRSHQWRCKDGDFFEVRSACEQQNSKTTEALLLNPNMFMRVDRVRNLSLLSSMILHSSD
jgi:hypothetical protein